MGIASRSPYNGVEAASFTALNEADISSAIERAADAFIRHRLTSFEQRKQKMLRVADLLEEGRHEYGRILTEEMGKTLAAAIAEVEKCAAGCRFYAEQAESMLRDEQIDTSAEKSFVAYQPLGVILAVMPWNFPFWQVFRFAAPAVMAGNVALLKHASNVPRAALAISEIFHEAGFERGVFTTLLIGSEQVAQVIADPRVAAATLTGSEAAGRSLARHAGAHLKKVVLELGGSDPFIVMPSADIERAAEVGVKARTINNGQSCIAAKRFIIHRSIADAFIPSFVKKMSALRLGDPMDDDTDIGPLATQQIADELDLQVRKSVEMGARILTGGTRGEGIFYPPTVLTDIAEGSPADVEELFGPVASLFVVDDIDAAIERANATRFGLASSVWTNDSSEREKFIRDLETGQLFVNAMVASDPRVPFGGVKASGYGRELSHHGIREFVNAKTVWIEGKAEQAE